VVDIIDDLRLKGSTNESTVSSAVLFQREPIIDLNRGELFVGIADGTNSKIKISDVLTYANRSSFPATGINRKVYLDMEKLRFYIWLSSNSSYNLVSGNNTQLAGYEAFLVPTTSVNLNVATVTKIPFSSFLVNNPSSSFSLSSNGIVIPKSGLWNVAYDIVLESASSTKYLRINCQLRNNGNLIAGTLSFAGWSTSYEGSITINKSVKLSLVQGDIIDLVGWRDAIVTGTSSLNLDGCSINFSFLGELT
jgi:hypothetical protein